jgi:hypothetical protein
VEDHVLWTQYIYKYVYETDRKGVERTFTEDEARKLWDAYVYLRLKCPSLDVKETVQRIESFLPKAD